MTDEVLNEKLGTTKHKKPFNDRQKQAICKTIMLSIVVIAIAFFIAGFATKNIILVATSLVSIFVFNIAFIIGMTLYFKIRYKKVPEWFLVRDNSFNPTKPTLGDRIIQPRFRYLPYNIHNRR